MMSFDEFRSEILEAAEVAVKEKGWRRGQAVFNYVADVFCVARETQFRDGVDCFFNDDLIEDFIILCYKHLREFSDVDTNHSKN